MKGFVGDPGMSELGRWHSQWQVHENPSLVSLLQTPNPSGGGILSLVTPEPASS